MDYINGTDITSRIQKIAESGEGGKIRILNVNRKRARFFAKFATSWATKKAGLTVAKRTETKISAFDPATFSMRDTYCIDLEIAAG